MRTVTLEPDADLAVGVVDDLNPKPFQAANDVGIDLVREEPVKISQCARRERLDAFAVNDVLDPVDVSPESAPAVTPRYMVTSNDSRQ